MSRRPRRLRLIKSVTFIVALTIVGAATLTTSRATIAAAAVAEREENMSALSFEQPENLVYQGEFSKSLLRGIDILEMHFTAERVRAEAVTATKEKEEKSTADAATGQNGELGESREAESLRPRLRFTGEVVTKGWFGRLFNLRFKYRSETLVDAATRAALRTDKTDEQGERVRVSEAVFDRRKDEVTWTERDPRDPQRAPRVVTSDLGGAPHDVVSAFYYLRTQRLTVGREFELALSDSGAVYCVPVKVVEAKRLKTALGEVPAVRVEVGVFGRIVERKGSFSIWFTDDERHLPVQARINSEFGTLDLKLKKRP